MDHDAFSQQVLAALCKSGDVEGVQIFLERTLPSLPQERQSTFCHHLTGDPAGCDNLPCTTSILHLAGAAAQGGQADVFAYLWDTFLAPRGISSIPWRCLRVSAYQGAIPLAQAFWVRDSDCFNTIEPQGVHPIAAKRARQIEVAIRSDRFEYIDFMLAHGAYINASKDLLSMVVRCAVDDGSTLRRIHFLVSRGLRIADSMALQEAVAGGNVEIATCLLDNGASTDDAVIVAAREGYLDVVQLLLDRGTESELPEAVTIAKENGHDDIVRLLQERQHQRQASKRGGEG